MTVQRALIGGLVALSAFQIAEGLQAASILKKIQAEGVYIELDLPIVGKQRVLLAPPKSDGSKSSPDTFDLPADAKAAKARMHRVSLIVALLLGAAAFAVTAVDKRRGD